MRGNPENLRAAAARKSAAANSRAEQGLNEMLRHGQPITFRGLAHTAGVSLDFLYRTPDIRRRVEQLRAQQQTTPPATDPQPHAADPDEPSNVIRTLTAKITELKRQHREQVTVLQQALEAAQGENLELRRSLGHRRARQPTEAPHP